MPSVLHVVVTENFAGVERYVCDVAGETAGRGWDVTVVGGRPDRMRAELRPEITWRPGGTVVRAVLSVLSAGHQDVVHVHMTAAELVGVLTGRRHRARLVSTRHFAAPRGASRLGKLVAPLVTRHLDCQIAISHFAASKLESPPDAVIHNGVPNSPLVWRPESRTVLVLQRLEPEKDTGTAIQAWVLSGLAERGWNLRIVGEGSQRPVLERLVADEQIPAVTFAGWLPDVRAEFAQAGLLLASAPAEPFGLSVVEAMAAGVPVVAVTQGGYAETIGEVAAAPRCTMGDAGTLADSMSMLAGTDSLRCMLSATARSQQRRYFTIQGTADHILAGYAGLGIKRAAFESTSQTAGG